MADAFSRQTITKINEQKSSVVKYCLFNQFCGKNIPGERTLKPSSVCLIPNYFVLFVISCTPAPTKKCNKILVRYLAQCFMEAFAELFTNEAVT